MITYLITGAQGLVGRYLSQVLIDAQPDARVVGVGRSPRNDGRFSYALTAGSGQRAPLPAAVAASLRERFAYHQLDVLDSARLRDLLRREKPEVVFHLAAALRYADHGEINRGNVAGTVAVLEAVAAIPAAKKVILASTGGVYGMLPSDQLPAVESAPCAPVDVYAVSKLAAEHEAWSIGQAHDICVVAARIFNVCGPGQDDRHVCGRFAAQACSGSPVIRVHGLTTTRDFIDVRDVAAALVRLAQRGECGRAYNVASGVEVSIGDVLERVIRLSGFSGAVVPEHARSGLPDAPRHYGDTSRLHALGFAHRYTLDDSLRDLLAYYRGCGVMT